MRFTPFLLLLLLGACKLGPDYTCPEIDLPDRWRASVGEPVAGAAENPADWWQVFDDPVLTRLIGDAYEQNLSVQAAGLRIVQARAGRSMAFQLLFPAIVGNAAAARSYHSQEVRPDVDVSFPNIDVNPPKKTAPRLRRFLRDFLPSVTNDGELDVEVSDHIDIYSAGLNALWEIDLFGKTRRRIEASTAEVEAAIGAYDAALVSLAGEVALTYVQIRTAQARLDIARDHVAALATVLTAAEARSDATAAIDARLARAALRGAEVDVLAMEKVLRESENALCVLLALPPADASELLGERRPIPAAPTDVALGVPADLLRRRPDIRAAERFAAAQCARIGVARTQAIAPSFKLLGSLGVAASDLSDLGKSTAITAGYGGVLGWNIFLYPWLVENVRIADAQYEEQILLYRDTVLRAAEEVENASYALLKARQQLPLLEDGARASREAFDLAEAGYRDGDIQFPWLMDSIQYRLRDEQREAATRGEAALRLVTLYKALGGGWQIREGKPFVPEEMKERMRERTDWWTFSGKRILEDEVLE